MINKESKEQVLQHFLELGYHDRVDVLERIAGDEEGEPIDMFVEANLVMSEDQFREAKLRLSERGYSVDFVGI
ncbi:MAG: hypothetical protein ABFD64_12525 [Armatimonadota bacterium]